MVISGVLEAQFLDPLVLLSGGKILEEQMFFSPFLLNIFFLKTQATCDPFLPQGRSNPGSSALAERGAQSSRLIGNFRSSAGSQIRFLLNSYDLFFHFLLFERGS